MQVLLHLGECVVKAGGEGRKREMTFHRPPGLVSSNSGFTFISTLTNMTSEWETPPGNFSFIPTSSGMGSSLIVYLSRNADIQ